MILRRVTEHTRTHNWFAVVLDLIVVVVGVFLGLQVTQWNEDRHERVAEREYVERLVEDLEADIAGFRDELQDLDLKEASLRRVQAALHANAAGVEDPEKFLVDIAEAANRGWNQWEARRSTFDELIGSGQLNLLRAASMREAIAAYYDNDAGTAKRIDARETRFPELSYQLAPRANEAARTYDEPTAVDLDGVELSELVDAVFASGLRDSIIAEINFSRFVRGMDEARMRRATDLLERLESYREAIE
jgi:hypothetical protein